MWQEHRTVVDVLVYKTYKLPASTDVTLTHPSPPPSTPTESRTDNTITQTSKRATASAALMLELIQDMRGGRATACAAPMQTIPKTSVEDMKPWATAHGDPSGRRVLLELTNPNGKWIQHGTPVSRTVVMPSDVVVCRSPGTNERNDTRTNKLA